MTKLKSCPVCGGKAKARYGQPFGWVYCINCQQVVICGDWDEQGEGLKAAINAWNRRVDNDHTD